MVLWGEVPSAPPLKGTSVIKAMSQHVPYRDLRLPFQIVAPTQKKYAKAWQMHRANKDNGGGAKDQPDSAIKEEKKEPKEVCSVNL